MIDETDAELLRPATDVGNRMPDNVVPLRLSRSPSYPERGPTSGDVIRGHSQERRAVRILGIPVIERTHTFPSHHRGAPLPSTQRHRLTTRAVMTSLVVVLMAGGAPAALRILGLT